MKEEANQHQSVSLLSGSHAVTSVCRHDYLPSRAGKETAVAPWSSALKYTVWKRLHNWRPLTATRREEGAESAELRNSSLRVCEHRNCLQIPKLFRSMRARPCHLQTYFKPGMLFVDGKNTRAKQKEYYQDKKLQEFIRQREPGGTWLQDTAVMGTWGRAQKLPSASLCGPV